MATGSTDDIEAALEEFDGDLPAGVDEAAITRMRRVAHVLDEGITVPGTSYRIGLDPIVGILPGAGDVVISLVSLYIVGESAKMGVSQSTILRMLANIAVDTIGGSVPLIGVLFDAVWKSNKWNVQLALEDLAGQQGAESGPETVVID